jgi:O-antigen ligase
MELRRAMSAQNGPKGAGRLRYAVLVVIFLALTMENPAEAPAMGLWKSPLYPLGELLFLHLNLVFPGQGWLIFSGFDAILVGLLVAAVLLGRGGATPVRPFVLLCLAGVAWIWASGMMWGGADFASSLWQVQRAASLPLWGLLFEFSLRGRADRVAVGTIVLVAACLKAALALWLRATLAADESDSPYMTVHADSMLFACAFCLVVVLLFLGSDRRYALALPLLVGGMIANNRRVVWVELATGLAVVYALSPRTPAKRAVRRMVLRVLPIALFYCAVGWFSGTGIFAPVRVLRSMVDSRVDGSTQWRDWENYNVCYTLSQNPLLGTGYGHPYEEAVKLPDVTGSYALERYAPHNSILGLWAYGGLVGFTALWSMLVVAVFLAARAARHATRPSDCAAAVAAVAAILVYIVHCYGDMGLGTWASVCTAGPALAFAGHLAVSTGAWPSGARAPSPATAKNRGSAGKLTRADTRARR